MTRDRLEIVNLTTQEPVKAGWDPVNNINDHDKTWLWVVPSYA